MSDMAADTRDVPCLTPRCLYVGQPRKSDRPKRVRRPRLPRWGGMFPFYLRDGWRGQRVLWGFRQPAEHRRLPTRCDRRQDGVSGRGLTLREGLLLAAARFENQRPTKCKGRMGQTKFQVLSRRAERSCSSPDDALRPARSGATGWPRRQTPRHLIRRPPRRSRPSNRHGMRRRFDLED